MLGDNVGTFKGPVLVERLVLGDNDGTFVGLSVGDDDGAFVGLLVDDSVVGVPVGAGLLVGEENKLVKSICVTAMTRATTIAASMTTIQPRHVMRGWS